MITGTVLVQAEASDDRAVDQVEFFLDGTSLGVDSDASDGYSITWDSGLVSDGDYQISAVATDDGLQDTVTSISVSVDNEDSIPVANAGPDQTVQDIDGGGSESVLLDGSGSSDDRGITSYEWYSESEFLGSGVTLSVDCPVGTHTITLVVTDSIEQPAQDEVVITVEAAPLVASQVSVTSVSLLGYGGKNGNNHLQGAASVQDNLGANVVGAVVDAELYHEGTLIASSTSTTDAAGSALLFDERRVAKGCYSIIITNVTAPALTFDGVTPTNGYCK